MANTRIIRPIPLGPVLAPSGAVLVDGNIDYIEQGEVVVPVDAVYAATLDDSGKYTEVKAAPAEFVMRHAFAGWQDALSVADKATLEEAVKLDPVDPVVEEILP